MRIDKLKPGRRPSTNEYNKLVDAINRLMKVKGRNGVTVRSTSVGMTILGTGEVGSSLRKAFAINDAPATTTIPCYLDTDGGSSSITIDCEIVGGSALNNAIPRLMDGSMMYVTPDSAASSGWSSVMTFQATTDCS